MQFCMSVLYAEYLRQAVCQAAWTHDNLLGELVMQMLIKDGGKHMAD